MQYLFIPLSALFSITLLFLLCKLMGSKQISQMSMFDYITGISIGSIAAEMATELETPLKPALAMLVYALVAVGISLWTNASLRARRFFTGRPILLMDAGVIYKENMQKARLDLTDFLSLARIQGYYDPADIQTAIMEENGTVSFLPKSEARPVQPRDLENYPQQEHTLTSVILDGFVLESALREMGHDKAWLTASLGALGYKSPRQVYLALCSKDGQLSAYPMRG